MSTTRSEHVYSYELKDGRTRYYCLFYFQTWDGRHVKKKKSGFQTVREAKAWEQDFIQSHTNAPRSLADWRSSLRMASRLNWPSGRTV